MSAETQKRFLVAALNWGLGHITRVVPVIRELRARGHEVLVGGSPAHHALILKEFPDIEFMAMPSLSIRLSGGRSQVGAIVRSVPSFLLAIRNEHVFLKRWLKTNSVDAILSDNCYGLWHRTVPSYFITHQVTILLPPKWKCFQPMVNCFHHRLISRFTQCWIPDFPDARSLAGKLSAAMKPRKNLRYIGPLSRLSPGGTHAPVASGQPKVLLLISGPEPQRTLFETAVISQWNALGSQGSVSVIRGLPQQGERNALPNGWYNHVTTDQMEHLLGKADLIICRSGYSTLMDLVAMGKRACLVPTPGQTEQEYLAGYFQEKWGFLSMDQHSFSLSRALEWWSESSKTVFNLPQITYEGMLMALDDLLMQGAEKNGSRNYKAG